jgi:hypothetical protein
MPYKNPEHKQQWEREHREERNARRRMQRLDGRSGQRKSVADLLAALRTRHRDRNGDPSFNQTSQGTWKPLFGWAVGIGIVLLAAFAGASGFNADHFGTRGSGNSGGASGQRSC